MYIISYNTFNYLKYTQYCRSSNFLLHRRNNKREFTTFSERVYMNWTACSREMHCTPIWFFFHKNWCSDWCHYKDVYLYLTYVTFAATPCSTRRNNGSCSSSIQCMYTYIFKCTTLQNAYPLKCIYLYNYTHMYSTFSDNVFKCSSREIDRA